MEFHGVLDPAFGSKCEELWVESAERATLSLALVRCCLADLAFLDRSPHVRLRNAKPFLSHSLRLLNLVTEPP
jgi:hypothetical protein